MMRVLRFNPKPNQPLVYANCINCTTKGVLCITLNSSSW